MFPMQNIAADILRDVRQLQTEAEETHEKNDRAKRLLGDLQEGLNEEQLIAEKYLGIRPAPGYPACPDHTEKADLFELLKAPQNAAMTLTESFAMLPTAAVSGFYFSHPQARYFALGKIGRDQVEDYARRKGMTLAEAERWLAPNLGYEPQVRNQTTTA